MADNGIGWTRFPRGDAFFPEISMTFREHAVPIVGITALLAWMEALLCFEGVLRDDVMYGGGIVHDPFSSVLRSSVRSAAQHRFLSRATPIGLWRLARLRVDLPCIPQASSG